MEPSIIQQLGWVWLAHAREGVKPLTLLEADEKGLFQRIIEKISTRVESATALNGDIFALFPTKSDGKKPKISEPEDVASFNGHDILSVKVGVTIETIQKLSVVGNATAISNLKVADKLLFSFENVKRLFADEIQIEKYLNVIKPDAEIPGFIEKLNAGQIFIVTEVLQTTSFKIRSASEFQYSGKLEANAVAEFVKLKLENETEKDSDSRISYKGDKPVTFALKAFKIMHNKEKNHYTLSKTPLKVVRGDNKLNVDTLQTEDGLIDIE